jgi:hypothetical protein
VKQSRAMSFVESIINIAVGFGLSILCQALVLPALGVPMPWGVNFAFAGVMTVVSIARQFCLRRLFEALHIRRPLSPAMQAVIAERCRQIEAEGFDARHDQVEHWPGEIAAAGACYALGAGKELVTPPQGWPWTGQWWKPRDFRRDLVRAGALIVAEIEKFDRNRKPKKSPGGMLAFGDDIDRERRETLTRAWEGCKFERYGTGR